MTIPVYEWPDQTFRIRTVQPDIVPHSRGFESPLNRAAGYSRLDGPRWEFEVTVTAAVNDNAAQFAAFLDKLDGRVGAVALLDPKRRTPQGVAAGGHVGAASEFSDATGFSDGTDFADGSDFAALGGVTARGDDSILIAGLVASTVAVLVPGDLMQLGSYYEGSQLLRVVSAANSDASGNARVVVRPRIRKAFVAGTSIKFRDPRGRFRLASDDQGLPPHQPFRADGHSYRFVEIMTQ